VLTVDLDALARNYRRLKQAAAPAICSAVVKANAYGLGMEPVARRLFHEGCRHFFVATLAEGQALRRVLSEPEIFVLEGALAGNQQALLEARLVPALNTLAQVDSWARAERRAILHIDTGMNRLGLTAAEVQTLGTDPARLGGMRIEYVMTHLACADEPSHPLNARQLRDFSALRRLLPAARTSIGNSAGVFMGSEHCGDLVRPGIGLYGGNPFADRPSPFDVVATLTARVLQLREVEPPRTVGYGGDAKVRSRMRLATLGLGYADGYPRALSGCGIAMFDGWRLPVVGRVSMDLITLDVSAVPAGEIEEGQTIELIGAQMRLEELAQQAGTINYEILTGIGQRVYRQYRGRV
jgi:alanine racemase